MPLFSPRKQYNSLDEELVLPPLRPTTILQPEHFSAPLQGLSYPVALDFSHERFKLKSFSLLTQLKPAALAEINLTDNELRSIADLSRFVALKTLVETVRLGTYSRHAFQQLQVHCGHGRGGGRGGLTLCP